ncbi:MAG: zinc metalloprotease HtpX, partial [Actinobacteria bacterium]|nr:zinc metalloprotease HtpX [Actinomycetota bacterium]
EKRWRVWLLFALLVGILFVAAWVACFIVAFSLFLSFPVVDTFTWVFTLQGVGLILGVALAGSLLYWFGSRLGARGRLLRAMHCRPLDAGDRYHQRLANIVEEMRIATGAPRIECFTVRTLGLNAFAFSDLHGEGVIGVTEGALARLSRQQLQGVVAHEFGHILSGSYVTVTVSCLLFGIYSELGDRLEDAALATGGTRAAPFALVAIALRGWLWVLQLASSVMNSALSRERERQADLAASRYTRDPLSLAEALRIISRHPGGAGYIPEGLAPLCIRDTQAHPPWLRAGRRATHPPIGERVDMLVALANVSPEEFARQVDAAAGTFDKREHWAAAPAAGGGARRIGLETAGAVLGPAATLVAPPVRSSAGGAMACPSCGAGLSQADYEGLRVTVCASCGGRLVSPAEVSKILARREVAFTEGQRRVAELLIAGGDQLRRAARLARGRPGVHLIACPSCARTMVRRHFSYEHAVEIDYCSICDLFWFEKDELEALQIIAERQAG